ncbi:MAG: cupin domain-containing protein [Methylomonas sp.]
MHESAQSELDELNSLFLEDISPLPVDSGRQTAMRQALMGRAAASIAQKSGFLNVRARHGAWRTLKPGIRVKQLWRGLQGGSVLIEFAPGASLPAHRHNWLEEGIVLSGDLQMAELQLGRLDYQVSPAGSRHAPIQSQQGALAYLRGTSLGDTSGVLLEVLGGLLPFGKKNRSQTIYANEKDVWAPVTEGVFRKQLWSDGERTSFFYRFQAGAKLHNLTHSLEQEYMVLEGDIFMDDALLRAGDYQLAPAGSKHDEIYSDVGATFFVRGA